MTDAPAEVAVHVVVVRTEVKVPRAVRAVGIGQTRPVEAVAASEVELVVAKASAHAVLLRPRDSRVVVELLEVFLGGHTPVSAPVDCGCIILDKTSVQRLSQYVRCSPAFPVGLRADDKAKLGKKFSTISSILAGETTIGFFGK